MIESASTSTSTSASRAGSIKRLTSTMELAGRIAPNTCPARAWLVPRLPDHVASEGGQNGPASATRSGTGPARTDYPRRTDYPGRADYPRRTDYPRR